MATTPADRRTVQGQAWFKVADEKQRLTWDSAGDSDYHGDVTVEPDGQGSRVTFSLHTDAQHPGIDRGIEDPLDKSAELSARGVPQH